MKVKISEKPAKTILTRSGIDEVDYCLNPYTGCFHGCIYCYATFMKRFSGHMEPWGTFVDVKINAHEILEKQLSRISTGSVMISSVTDPYQPAESRYRITRKCLEVLADSELEVSVLTKSPLVLRDIDLFARFGSMKVGVTVTTDDDRIRRIFEPNAPPVSARIRALRELREKGIYTYAFIGPVLPMDPESLARKLGPFIDAFIIDRMNYISKSKRAYQKHGFQRWMDPGHSMSIVKRLEEALEQYGSAG